MSDIPAGAAPAPAAAPAAQSAAPAAAATPNLDHLSPAARRAVEEGMRAEAAAKKAPRPAPKPAAPARAPEPAALEHDHGGGGQDVGDLEVDPAELGEGDLEADAGAGEAVKLTLKVNGEEVPYEFDPKDPASMERLQRDVQKGIAADAKLREAAGVKRRAQELVSALQQNPFQVLLHPALGMNENQVRQAAEKWLFDRVQHDAMPQDERDRLQERKELEAFRSREQQRQEQEQSTQREAAKEQLRQRFSTEIVSAMDTAQLPKNDWTISRMAQYMREGIRQGMKVVNAADVVELVREDWLSAQRQLLSTMDGDKLVEVLGKDGVEKVARTRLKGVQSAPGQRSGSPAARAPARPTVTYGSPEEARDAAVARARRGA